MKDGSACRSEASTILLQVAALKPGCRFPCIHICYGLGLYYRAALLLEPLGLSLRQCCLLWNLHHTSTSLFPQEEIEYRAISRFQEEGFLFTLERIKAFTKITAYDNLIDYILDAFLLFPRLEAIPKNYWLTPSNWLF